MNEHKLSGKPVALGMPAIYTDAGGRKHQATIKNLVVVVRADLQAEIDGTSRFVEGVVYNEGGAAQTWTHHLELEAEGPPAEQEAGNQETPPASEEETQATEASQPKTTSRRQQK